MVFYTKLSWCFTHSCKQSSCFRRVTLFVQSFYAMNRRTAKLHEVSKMSTSILGNTIILNSTFKVQNTLRFVFQPVPGLIRRMTFVRTHDSKTALRSSLSQHLQADRLRHVVDCYNCIKSRPVSSVEVRAQLAN